MKGGYRLSHEYFSDRHGLALPRTQEEFTEAAWGGISGLIDAGIANGGFGVDFPDPCFDPGAQPIGTDRRSFEQRLTAEIPQLDWPDSRRGLPPTLAILDAIEFGFRHISEAKQDYWHSFGHHHHLTFDRRAGQARFHEEVNLILARNGLAYELKPNGQVERIGPPELSQVLRVATFHTGDDDLDQLLQTARAKYSSPDLNLRKEALEKLWDAWERLKSVENPTNKRDSIKQLLDRTTAEPRLREEIDNEAKAITDLGNQFRIRHAETDKVPISTSEEVDYFFQRGFASILLILRRTGRA